MKSRILNYVDFERSNTLLEGFNKATGFVTAILDLDGNVLSKSGWRQICTDFHRKNSETAYNCTVSDTQLANNMVDNEKYHYYKCLNGLVDIGVPIVIRGEHIANLFSGQFFFEEPDISFFKKQAQTFGFEEQSYLEALGKVPVVSKEKVDVAMNFLLNITQMIIEMTAEKLDQIELYDAIKNSEAALLESQVKLQQNNEDLLESQRIAHIGTWRLKIETNEVVWSEELYKMYGFDPKLPPPPFSEHMKLFTPDSWEKLSASVERARTFGIPYELELKTIRADGSNGWMWVRGEAKKNTDGNIVALRGATQDITERKQIEENLRASEVNFKAISELSPMAVYASIGSDQKAIYTNKAFHEMFGFSIEDVPTVNHWWIRAFPDNEYRQQIINEWSDSIVQANKNNVDVKPLECVCTCKDGSEKYIVWVGKTLRDEFWAFGYDITERTRAHNDLEEALKFNQDIINSSSNGIIVYDTELRYEIFNPFMEKLWGISANAVIGRKAEEVFPWLKETGVINNLEMALEGQHLGEIDFTFNLPETEKSGWARDQSGPIYNRSGDIVGVLGIVQNITERKNANDLLKEMNKSLALRLLQTINAISKIIELRDVYTAGHQRKVADLACAIAKELGLSDEKISNISSGALIHDIGKINIASDILNKPGKISSLEYQILQTHAEFGYEIVREIDFPPQVIEMIHQHHERLDGSGYPQKLAGDQIILESRILAVADVVEAMTSHRPYRPALGIDVALEEISLHKGEKYDCAVVDACVTLFREKGFQFKVVN